MLDVPVDALAVRVGVAAASLVALGVVTSLPLAPPPDAAAAADAVDSVAASEGSARIVHPVAARSVRLATDVVVLAGPRGETDAPLAYGPVTPVREGTVLYRVLGGKLPAEEFRSPAALETAAADARSRVPVETEADRLVVRRVVWEGVDVTLVGA